MAEVVVKVTAFKAKVNAAIELLKDAYRCNYRCGFNLGCRFSRNSYSRSCVRIPTPEKTSYKLAGLGAFKVDWNGCAYNCLRTCTVAEKTPVFEETKHRDPSKPAEPNTSQILPLRLLPGRLKLLNGRLLL